MKRVNRSGVIDQTSGTTIYTVPVAGTASLSGLRFSVGNIATAITLSSFVSSSGVTTTYTLDLLPGDQMSDDTTFVLAAGDYIKVESTSPGVTYYAYIDIP